MANAYCLWLRSNFPMRSNYYFSFHLPPPLLLPPFLSPDLSLSPLPSSSDGRKLILSSHQLTAAHTTHSPPFSLFPELFGSNDIYAALIGRVSFTCASTLVVIQRPVFLTLGPISSHRHGPLPASRSCGTKSPPKWITCSRLLPLLESLARGNHDRMDRGTWKHTTRVIGSGLGDLCAVLRKLYHWKKRQDVF